MKVGQAASLMDANVDDLSSAVFDNEIKDFAIDSRSVEAGELFFALSQEDYARAGFNGTFVDAHRYIPQAIERRAVACVARTDRVQDDEGLRGFRDRLLLVPDAIAALQQLAHRVYLDWGKPVVAITGSAGKTTAKELTAHVLSTGGRRILKSQKNYNNNLGLPLAVLQLVSEGNSPEDFDLAVLEMGMSSPTHEIRRLTLITPPDVGVELIVAPVHLEYLGTIENVAAAKAELIEGLKPGGVAVLNADDELVMTMREKHSGRVVTFGLEHRADVTATGIDSNHLGSIAFVLQTPLGEAPVQLPMSGRHNLMNALAAAAVGVCFEMPAEMIAFALNTAVPPRMRGEVLEFAAGFRVIDDSYNSNPRSLSCMIETLASAGAAQRRIVIAGEMLELGTDAAELHRAAGQEMAEAGIDVVWGVRGLGREIVEGASVAGVSDARFFDNADDVAAAIGGELRSGDLVLIKGSRGVATDKIVSALRAQFALAGEEGKVSTVTR